MENKTNTQRVTEYMDFGSPLKQAFVIEAISRYANEVVKNQKEIHSGMKHSFVSPDAWIACAKDWQATEPKGD
jgi:hypothetical protein